MKTGKRLKSHEKITGVLSHADARLGQQSGYFNFCQENCLRKQEMATIYCRCQYIVDVNALKKGLSEEP